MRASYSYTLDAASRLTSETQTWASGASTDTIGYTYTNNNQLTGVTHSNGSFANESFSFDANGNRNSSGYSTGTGNELSSDGTYNYTYDANGNETSRTNISTGVETVYKWDFRNRLTEVDSVVSGVSTVLASYTYDALDRRIGVSEGGSTTWTLYNGASPILDFNASGIQIARYMDGPTPSGVDEVLARETSGGVAWYLEDRLGSVGDIVDNTGALIDHIAYSAFGNVLSETNPSNGDRFKYAGLQYDAATGLNFALHRVEDAATGRWLSQDPIEFSAGDVNLYRYVGNQSVNQTDTSGLDGSGMKDPMPQGPDGGEEGTPKGGHSKGKRPSTEGKHQKGDRRRLRDQGGEKKQKRPGWKQYGKGVTYGAAGACAGYFLYRGVRLLPSLLPPFWPTLPVNIAVP